MPSLKYEIEIEIDPGEDVEVLAADVEDFIQRGSSYLSFTFRRLRDDEVDGIKVQRMYTDDQARIRPGRRG